MRLHLVTALILFSHIVLFAAEKSDVKPADNTRATPPNEGGLQDVKEFGEKVANRVDRVIKKKAFELGGDPWLFQGIPLVFPSDSSGFNLGAKVQLQDIARQDPHKIEIEAQMLTSDLGRYKHALRVEFPHAFEKYWVTARVAYDRDIAFNYYGIGNETTVDQPLSYYSNVREGPSFTLSVQRFITPTIRLGPIVGFRWMNIGVPAGSLIAAQMPLGAQEGTHATHYVGAAISYDTLDFEPYPSRGSLHELYTYLYGPYTGSSYTFQRYTYTYKRFVLLHRQLIFAHRTLLEALSGDIPFYEMSGVGGSDPTIGLGGDKYFRGYDSDRFIDRYRLIFGFELRWDPVFFDFAKQQITLGFVPWFDIGRVWSELWPVDVSHLHASAGWGVRMIWNSRFIIRTDFAVTTEGTKWIVNLGSDF